MSFDSISDDQLAKEISARVAELKARHAKRQKELEDKHRQTMQDAFSAEGAKKRGRKANAVSV